MALSLIQHQAGTHQSNQNGTYNESFTLDSSTKSLVLVVTNYDTADGLTGAWWGNSQQFTLATSFYDSITDGWVYIYYLNEPTIGTDNIWLNHAGTTITDLMFGFYELSAKISLNKVNTGQTGNGSPSVYVPSVTFVDDFCVCALFSDQAQSEKISELSPLWDIYYLQDLGSDTGASGAGFQNSDGNFFFGWNDSDNDEDYVAVAASFTEIVDSVQITPPPASTKVDVQTAVLGEAAYLDFEEGDTSDFDSTAGTFVGVNTISAFEGTYGFWASLKDSAGQYGIKEISTPNEGGYVQIRFYFKFNISYPFVADKALSIFTCTNGIGENPLYFLLSYTYITDTYKFEVLATRDSSSSEFAYSTNNVLDDTWYCLEFRYYRRDRSESNGYVQWWIDEVEQDSLTLSNLEKGGYIEKLYIGDLSTLDPLGSSDYFRFDDIIVRDDGAYIGPVSAGVEITPSPASVVVDALQGGQAIVPAPASTIVDSVDPTFQNPILITPPSASAVASAPAPTVYTPLELTPPLASVVVSTVDPALPLQITPSPASTVVNTVAPTVESPLEITPPAASVIVDSIDPTVYIPLEITPSAASVITDVVAPAVYTPFEFTPTTASVIVSCVDPTVVEAVYITATPVSTIVSTVDPTVTAPFEYVPLPASAVVSTIDPQVSSGVLISPPAAYAVVRTVSPQVYTPIYATPTPCSVVVGVVAPTVYEPEYITPTPASTVVDVVAPTVYTPLEITAVASVITDTVAPSVITPVTISPTEATLVVSTVDPSVYTPLDISPQPTSVIVDVSDPTVIESVYISPAYASVIVDTIAPTFYSEENITPVPAGVVVGSDIAFIANAVRVFEFATAEGWTFTRTQGTTLQGIAQNGGLETYTESAIADDAGYWEWTGSLNDLFGLSESILEDLFVIGTEGVSVFVSVDSNQIGPLDMDDVLTLLPSRVASGVGEVTTENILLAQSLNMSTQRSIKWKIQVRTAP